MFQTSVKEKILLKDELLNSSYNVSGITVEEQDFYKVSYFSLSLQRNQYECWRLISTHFHAR